MSLAQCAHRRARSSIAARLGCGAVGPLPSSSLGHPEATAGLLPVGRLLWHVGMRPSGAPRREIAGSPTTAAGGVARRVLGGSVSLRWHDAVAVARAARLNTNPGVR